MASSMLRLTCQISTAAAGSYLRRVPISGNHVRRILCSAGMSTTTGGGDMAVRRVALPWLMLPQPQSSGDTAYSMYSLSGSKVVRLKPEPDGAKVVGWSHGWLALFDERDRNLFLWNPISHENIKLPLIDNISLPITDVSNITLSCPPNQGDECFAMMTYSAGYKMAHCYPGQSADWTPFYNQYSNSKSNSKSSLHEAKVVGSSHGWVALFHRNLFLWNPITHQNIKLPLIGTGDCPIEQVSMVMLSCPPEDGDECVALIAFSTAGQSELAYCRPGRSTNWSPAFHGRPYHNFKHFTNVVYSRRYRRFFCLGDDGSPGFYMMTWNPYGRRPISNRYWLTELIIGREAHSRECGTTRRLYVVYAQHSDQLYVVTRLLGVDGARNCNTVGFRVLVSCGEDVSCGKDTMRYTASLHGVVMFVGLNHSFAVPAAEFPELKPNSIYFADGDDVGIFDYENKTVSPCYYPVDRLHKIRSFWFTPPTSHAAT